MSFEDQITDYGAARFGSLASTETTPSAEIAEDTTTEVTNTSEDTTEIVASNNTSAAPEIVVPETPTLDYNSILEQISEGEFKDVDSFKSAIPKAKEYDSLLSRKTQLEAEIAEMVKPTNSYIKALNEMYANGATADQIKSFQRLNEVELSSLSPIELKVHKLVHEGYGEEIARKMVANEFPLEDFEEGSDERLILEEKLKIGSYKDLKELEQHKKDLSSFGEQKNQEQETARLQAIAQEESHKKEVFNAVPKIAEALKGLGEVVLKEGKDSNDAIKLNFDYTDDFKKEIPKLLNDFFVDYKLPVTPENIEKANKYISAIYRDMNWESILQTATKHIESTIWEKATNKYENRSGLAPETVNANQVNVNAERATFLNDVANRTRN